MTRGWKTFAICLQTIVLTFLAIWVTNHFNIFKSFNHLTDDQAFNIGLTAYLAILEAIASYAFDKIESRRASIVMTFYNNDNYNDGNCPTMLCDHVKGVGFIKCRITLDGNVEKLRKADIELPLSNWLSSQSHLPFYTYSNGYLKFDLNSILPKSGNEHHTVQDLNISFAINSGNTTLESTFAPELINRGFMLKLESKGFRAKIK